MTTADHDAVYDVLVRDCHANEAWRSLFKERLPDLEQPYDGFLFGGQLGHSGAFYVDEEGVWSVRYDEDEHTPKRDKMAAAANAALRELQGT